MAYSNPATFGPVWVSHGGKQIGLPQRYNHPIYKGRLCIIIGQGRVDYGCSHAKGHKCKMYTYMITV